MDIDLYYGKKIVAFLNYNPNATIGANEEYINNRCYIYPKYYQAENGVWETIEAEDFPTSGRIDVVISNNRSADEVCDELGCFVFVQINNVQIKEDPNAKTKYRARYHPGYGSGADIIIKELSSEKLNLWQVIETNIPSDQFIKDKKIINFTDNVFTSTVLVRIQDNFFGPFRTDKKGTEIEFAGLQDCDEIAGLYSYARLYNHMLTMSSTYYSSNNTTFIYTDTGLNMDFIEKYADKKIDWISDTELVNMLISTLKNASDITLFKSQLRQIRNAIEESVSLEKQSAITEERINRLQSMIQKGEIRADYLYQLTDFMMEDPESLQRLLESLVTDRYDLIEDKVPQIKEMQDIIDSKKEELQKIESDIEESKKRAFQENKEELDRIRKEAEAQISPLQDEIAALEEKKADLASRVDMTEDIIKMKEKREALDADIKRLQGDYDYQKQRNDRLESQIKQILADLKTESTLTGKLLDRKMIDRVLKTVSGEVLDEEESIIPYDKKYLSRDMSAAAIIDYVYNDIQNRANRNVSRNDIINYLLCIAQGFITVFAGEPGTGKTSLCLLLAKSLGLVREGSNNRYIEVSVERGWSSHKDYIGYYNPLTKRLEKGNAEIFDAFQALSNEAGTSDNAPFFLLLDEANLSPIEHYWSPFLKLCDSDSCSSNLLVLGGDVKWNVPRHLRFLATVNFDHTTEELSPRFIDRSWIISLEPEMLNLMDIEEEPVPCNEITFDYLSFENAFSAAGKNTEFSKAIAAKWESIQKAFKDNMVPIMPRNLKMVKNYCITASALMDAQTEETKYAPIDYAVAQKILPTISGTGEKYKKLIEDLLCQCDSMPLTKKHLRRMKEVAENNLGFYQFFAR